MVYIFGLDEHKNKYAGANLRWRRPYQGIFVLKIKEKNITFIFDKFQFSRMKMFDYNVPQHVFWCERLVNKMIDVDLLPKIIFFVRFHASRMKVPFIYHLFIWLPGQCINLFRQALFFISFLVLFCKHFQKILINMCVCVCVVFVAFPFQIKFMLLETNLK